MASGCLRSRLTSCTWGSCVVSDACNDADDTCDGHVDEGQSYVSGSSDVLLTSTVNPTGVVAQVDATTLWVAFADSRLGSARLSVGKFNRLTGAPLSPLGDIGHGTTGIGLYGSSPYPALSVMVGSDAWFVFQTPGGDKMVFIRATGGNATTPPALTVYPFVTSSFQVRLGGLATDGTNLYLSYSPSPGYFPPYPLRVAQVSQAGVLGWDVEIATNQQMVAGLAFDGTNLHAVHCTSGRVFGHARLSTTGTIGIADHLVTGTECDASANAPVLVGFSDNALQAATWLGQTSFQTSTLSLSGVLSGVTHTFAMSGAGNNDHRAALRAGTPPTFVVANSSNSLRVSADGFVNSRALEPGVVATLASRGVALYPPGGPLFVYVTPAATEIRMVRLQCP